MRLGIILLGYSGAYAWVPRWLRLGTPVGDARVDLASTWRWCWRGREQPRDDGRVGTYVWYWTSRLFSRARNTILRMLLRRECGCIYII